MKSCLDLAIVSSCLVPFVESFIIDKDRKFTPRRVIKRKGKVESIFTDHLGIEIKLKGLTRRQKLKTDKPASWNINKPGGWEIYKELTDTAAEKIDEVINNDKLVINEVVKKVENIENKVKFKAFGKTRPATKKKAAKKDESGNQEEKDMDLLKRQSSKIEEQINLIKSEKLGRVGSIFKMKEVINGPKKKAQEPNAIKHPKTGDLIVSAEGIKKVTLEYCVENLKNNNHDEEVKEAVNIKKELHDIRMMDTGGEGFEV